MQDKSKWSYVAGLFDGEGCISLCKHWQEYKPTGKTWPGWVFCIQITNTNTDLMQWLVANFGGVYYSQDGKSRKENWKPAFRWRVKGRKNEETFLLGILPYLVVKREQAILGLEYVRLFQVKDHKLRTKMAEKLHELNKRGKSVETNMSNSDLEKIESELVGDNEEELVVI